MRARPILFSVALCGLLAPGFAASALEAPVGEAKAIVSTPVLSTTVTDSGQPIVLPQKDVHLVVTTLDIPAGATLPEHKHLFQRYAYVLAGTLEVTLLDSGKVEIFKPGDFIVECLGQWHRGATVGAEPVKLLVIDQMENGQSNVVLK